MYIQVDMDHCEQVSEDMVFDMLILHSHQKSLDCLPLACFIV